MPSKRELLTNLTIGSRVAEDEVEELGRYFVETDQWRRIFAGDVDIVFGPKGAGKSAIYASLVGRRRELADRGIVLVAGENPRGTPAFASIVADPPTTEREFIGLWKFYILALLNSVIIEEGISSDPALHLRSALNAAGLAAGPGGLRGVVEQTKAYLKRIDSVEGGLDFDETGHPGLRGKITLGVPSPAQRAAGFESVDELLELAGSVLERADIKAWVVFDRLDVAFAETRDLEANALRALFKAYLDMQSYSSVRLKIFLRTDIWRAITREGFREASHITRTVTLNWTEASLLNLVVRRLLQNQVLVEAYEASPDVVLGSAPAQRAFFDRLVPDQIDSGRNPKTFVWMLGRVSDGTKQAAPRELIHLLSEVRDVQLHMLERGEPEPENGMLFNRQAFRDALPAVSRARLEQTLYAEYPALRDKLEALEREKTNHRHRSLGSIWGVTEAEARDVAEQLVEIGFFEVRGTKDDPDYWVPFLYRPALNLVQGSAEMDEAPAAEGEPASW